MTRAAKVSLLQREPRRVPNVLLIGMPLAALAVALGALAGRGAIPVGSLVASATAVAAAAPARSVAPTTQVAPARATAQLVATATVSAALPAAPTAAPGGVWPTMAPDAPTPLPIGAPAAIAGAAARPSPAVASPDGALRPVGAALSPGEARRAIQLGEPVTLGPGNDTIAILATNSSDRPKRLNARVSVQAAEGPPVVARGELTSLPPGQTRVMKLRAGTPIPRTYRAMEVTLDSVAEEQSAPAGKIQLDGVKPNHQPGAFNAQVEVRNVDGEAHALNVVAAFARDGRLVGLVTFPIDQLLPDQSRTIALATRASAVLPDATHVWIDALR